MSDVEHQKEYAQKLLLQVDDLNIVPAQATLYGPVAVAAAHVHATLALVGVLESIDAHLCGIQKLLNGKEGAEDE